MGSHLYGPLPLLLLLLRLSCCQSITLIPTTPRVVDSLLVFTFLECEIRPPDAMGTVGWRLPSGEFYTAANDTLEIHVSDIGDSVHPDNTTKVVFIVTISTLSYQHDGIYSCEIQDATTPDEWIAAQVDLQLRVNLGTDLDTQITVNDSEGEVQLRCEMTLFIREDEDLQWFKDGQLIRSGTDRYTVTYRDGTPSVSQNGGNIFVPGRVAVLTISNPEESDSGNYTCAVAGTEESIDFQVSVLSDTTATDESSSELSLPPIIGAIAGVLGVIVIVLLAVIIILGLRKRTTTIRRSEEYYHQNGLYGGATRSTDHTNTACSSQNATPQSYYVNTPMQADLEGGTDMHDYTLPNVSGCNTAPPHINTRTRVDLESDGYSDPRYYGEKDLSNGSMSNDSTQPDLFSSINSTATRPSKSRHIDTPPRAELEGGGYSNPRYRGDDLSAADLTSTPMHADMKGGGYCDPRYHAEVALKKGSLSNDSTQVAPDWEGGGYSDPRYHGEANQERGSLTEYTYPQVTTVDKNVYAQPELSGSKAADHTGTPVHADLEGDGYCDPRCYGEVDQDKGSLGDDSTHSDLCSSNAVTWSSAPTQADLEGDGYSDPRYYGK